MGTIIATPPAVTYTLTPSTTTPVTATPTTVKPTPVVTAGAAVNAVVGGGFVVVVGAVAALF